MEKAGNDVMATEKYLSEKEDLIFMLMHDLRTPLARARGLVEILGATQLTEDQKQIVQMILKATGEGFQLINDMLQINSIAHQNQEPVAAPIDLHLFVHELVKNHFAVAANEKKVHINIAVEDHLQVHIDALALQRIFDNLISNAIKFSGADATIHIKVLNTERYVYISVQDEGPGISAEDQKKLFKKFQKLSPQPTAGESSTGLGLYIVKNLVEKLRGTIRVKSEPGKGTEFIIRLDSHQTTAQ